MLRWFDHLGCLNKEGFTRHSTVTTVDLIITSRLRNDQVTQTHDCVMTSHTVTQTHWTLGWALKTNLTGFRFHYFSRPIVELDHISDPTTVMAKQWQGELGPFSQRCFCWDMYLYICNITPFLSVVFHLCVWRQPCRHRAQN